MKKLFRGLFLIAAISTLFVGNVFADSFTPIDELDKLRGDILAYGNDTNYKGVEFEYTEEKLLEELDEESPIGTVIVKLIKTDGTEDVITPLEVYDSENSEADATVRIGTSGSKSLFVSSEDVGYQEIIDKRKEISDTLKSKKVEQNDWKRFFGEMKGNENDSKSNGIRNIRGIINRDISPSLARGSEYMNREGAGVKDKINLILSVFMWFLWVGFLAFELINGACILFPIFRDKVTGDGTNIPWFLTVNTKQRLANMEEEPMKKWLTNEVTRIAVFFLITIGIFSGVFYLLIEAIMNLLPS